MTEPRGPEMTYYGGFCEVGGVRRAIGVCALVLPDGSVQIIGDEGTPQEVLMDAVAASQASDNS